MKLHVVSLPHTRVEQSFSGCAYTAKVLKFAKMMDSTYAINVYAPEGPLIPGATLVSCLSDKTRQDIFGQDDHNRLPAWPTDEQTAEFNRNVIEALRARLEPCDLILLDGRPHSAFNRSGFP
jgi:hypothetical protein